MSSGPHGPIFDLFPDDMWPIIINAVRIYAPYVVWPVAAVVGFIGYELETGIRGEEGMQTPAKEHSIIDEREERRLRENQEKDVTEVGSLKERKFIPKTIFANIQRPSNKE